MKENKLISIVIPVYNVKEYLVRCLESVINQTYKNIQIILVDDGSTDGSGQVCDSYTKKDARITTIHKKNGGLSSARNVGIEHCFGEYITFLDSDDWFSTDYVEKCVNELTGTEIELLLTPYIREYPNNSIKNPFFMNDHILFNSQETKDSIFARLFGPNDEEIKFPARVDDFSTAWGKFYLAKKCKRIKFVDTKIIGTEDAWFNINYIYGIKNCKYLGTTFYHYNKQNDNSLVNSYNKYLFNRWCVLYKKMESFIKSHNLDMTYKKRLDNRIICNLIALSNNIYGSNLGLLKKYRFEKKLLRQDLYRIKFKNFCFDKLSFPWKIFFKLCSHRQAMLLTIFIPVGEKLKGVLK